MKHDFEKLRELIDRYINSNKSFSLVRFPGERIVYENSDLRILPFNSRWSDGFSIFSKEKNKDQFYSSTEKEDYLSNLSGLIKELKISGNKVVVSTVIDGQLTDKQREDLPENIAELFNANPDCFASVFKSSQSGLWIVITPELLLKEKEGVLSTMALAGTRPCGPCQPWDSKNLIEQLFVTSYIKECWENEGLTVNIDPLQTVQAGPVEHICTNIYTEINKRDVFIKLINLMNPTPAVCGFPKEYALEKIAKFEKHCRQLYAGVICTERENGEKNAFVTLRCIHLSPTGRYNIYVGGGITANSIPENEWEETRLKASQLLKCLTIETILKNG